MRSRSILPALSMAITSSITVPALAQQTEGAFHLGLSTAVVSHTSGTTEIELPTGNVDADVSTLSWGLSGDNGVVLDMGYGVTDIVLVGAFLQLGGQSQSTEIDLPGETEVDASEFGLLIGPMVEVIFAPGSTVRPYIGAGVGFATFSSEDEDADSESSFTGVQLAGQLGIHAFAAEGFSIDPALVFGWGTASGETTTGATSVDASASAFNVGLGLGFSGWIL